MGKRIKSIVMGVVFGIALALISLLWPAPLLLIILLVTGGMMLGNAAYITALILYLGAIFALPNAIALLPDAVFSIIVATGAIVCNKNQKNSFMMLIGCCASALIGVLAKYGVLQVITQRDMIDYIYRLMPLQMGQMAYQMIISYIHTNGYTGAEALRFYLDGQQSVHEIMVAWSGWVPSIALFQSMLLGVVSYMIAQRNARRAKLEIVYAKPFRLWKLPKHFSLGMFAILLFSYIGNYMNAAVFESVTFAIIIVLYIAFLLQGLSTSMFFLSLYKNIFLYVLCVILSVSMVGMPLFVIGIIESMFNLRNRFLMSGVIVIQRKPPSHGQPREKDSDDRKKAEEINKKADQSEQKSREQGETSLNNEPDSIPDQTEKDDQ